MGTVTPTSDDPSYTALLITVVRSLTLGLDMETGCCPLCGSVMGTITYQSRSADEATDSVYGV